jgi:hypothetical protein
MDQCRCKMKRKEGWTDELVMVAMPCSYLLLQALNLLPQRVWGARRPILRILFRPVPIVVRRHRQRLKWISPAFFTSSKTSSFC